MERDDHLPATAWFSLKSDRRRAYSALPEIPRRASSRVGVGGFWKGYPPLRGFGGRFNIADGEAVFENSIVESELVGRPLQREQGARVSFRWPNPRVARLRSVPEAKQA